MKVEKIKLLPTFIEKMEDNAVWCASFNLVWKEFAEKFLYNDFEYTDKDNQTIKNLVKEQERKIVINENDYYIKSGYTTLNLKNEIMENIKNKFHINSDVLNYINFKKDNDQINFLLYAIIYFTSKFEYKFKSNFKKIAFGNNKVKVRTFGLKSRSKEKIKDQVHVLFYKNDKNFAIKIDMKDDKSLILYKTNAKGNFNQIFNEITENYKNDNDYYAIHSLVIPNLNFKLISEYEALKNKKFICNKDKKEYLIDSAMQSFKLELNNTGVRAKSEAVIKGVATCYNPPKINYVDLVFDDTFYMFICNNNEKVKKNDSKKTIEHLMDLLNDSNKNKDLKGSTMQKLIPIIALRIQDIENFI